MTGRLDSRALELFLAVAETLSFRQAAETLHMTQPPLSRAIRELEERLGARLFERSTQQVSLTGAGRALVPYARSVARLLREAQAKVQGETQGGALAGSVRLGVTSAAELPWMGRLVANLGGTKGLGTVSITSDTSPRLVRLLRTGRLDAAFIALPTRTGELALHEVGRLPMLVALPSSHGLARRRSLRLADLAHEPLFWFERSRQPAFYDHCQALFARHGFAPPRLKEPADHHVLLGEVASGKGVALLPSSFAGLKRTGVAYRRLAEGDELAVVVALAAREDRAALGRRLVKAVAEAKSAAP